MTASDIGVTNILSLSVRERNPWPVLREKPPPQDARCSWLAVRRGVQPSAVTTPLWKQNPCCCIASLTGCRARDTPWGQQTGQQERHCWDDMFFHFSCMMCDWTFSFSPGVQKPRRQVCNGLDKERSSHHIG